MRKVTVQHIPFDPKDLALVATTWVPPVLTSAIEADAKIGQGIRVLSAADVRQRLGKSKKQLQRLESEGRFPRRRQLSSRRVG